MSMINRAKGVFNLDNNYIGSSGSVRLRGGDIPEEGVVEYCTGGTWKAVCDTNWDNKNAFVVCRQMGLPATGK